MRSVPVAVISLLFLTAGFAASAPETGVGGDVAPGAPGPYTGPTAVPNGAQPWAAGIHHQCGKYALVFRNPDLREDEQDFVHAQGQFFIQFQAVGKGSSEVVRFSFSFGATQETLHSNPTFNCNEAMPESSLGQGTAGAYLLYYRSDFDAQDGFFVPILTNNVPDGEYGAAVHAYNAAGNEVARAWARAVVENCPSEPSLPNTCPNSASEEVTAQDKTLPWPMVLPGDGEQTNDVDGLTVEFGEAIKEDTLEISVNGKIVPHTDWDNPARDTDLMPLNDEDDCPGGQQIRLVCERAKYGPGFKYEGPVREGDIIRVSAQDANGNLGVKTVHYGAGTSGGTVDLEFPEIELHVLNGDTIDFRPGDFHIFNFRLDNVGGSESHTNLLAELPTDEEGEGVGLSYQWQDADGNPIDHVVVAAGGQEFTQLRVEAARGTPEALYDVNAVIEYDAGGQQSYKRLPLSVKIDQDAAGGHHQLHGDGIPTETPPTNNTTIPLEVEDGGDAPAPGVALALLAVAGTVLAVVARRRRA